MNSKFASLLAAAPRRSVRIDDTLEVFIGEDTVGTVDAKITAALKAGQTVSENGVTRWMTTREIFVGGAYVWDKAGNKVKAERYLHRKDATGYTAEVVGTCWVIP